jgi:adenylate kinase
MNPQAFIFIGRSGSGKGTQVSFVKESLEKSSTFPVVYIETGDKFRHFIAEEGFSQDLSRKIYQNDIRQPDFLACFMWSHALIEEVKTSSHVIFDGTPRSLTEAKLLDTALDFYSLDSVHVINLNVSRSWSEERLLSRGRQDDATLSRINKRLDWFDADVIPAIDYYRSSNKHHFVDINGEQEIEKVTEDIKKALA